MCLLSIPTAILPDYTTHNMRGLQISKSCCLHICHEPEKSGNFWERFPMYIPLTLTKPLCEEILNAMPDSPERVRLTHLFSPILGNSPPRVEQLDCPPDFELSSAPKTETLTLPKTEICRQGAQILRDKLKIRSLQLEQLESIETRLGAARREPEEKQKNEHEALEKLSADVNARLEGLEAKIDKIAQNIGETASSLPGPGRSVEHKEGLGDQGEPNFLMKFQERARQLREQYIDNSQELKSEPWEPQPKTPLKASAIEAVAEAVEPTWRSGAEADKDVFAVLEALYYYYTTRAQTDSERDQYAQVITQITKSRKQHLNIQDMDRLGAAIEAYKALLTRFAYKEDGLSSCLECSNVGSTASIFTPPPPNNKKPRRSNKSLIARCLGWRR